MNNPADQETEKPYSGMMRAAGNFAGALGRAVPSLSVVTGPTEWFTRTAANAISSFGYSKPLEVERATKTIQGVSTHQHNCDGYIPTLNLGFGADTKLGLMQLAGLDKDEMSFEFLKGIPTRFDMFNFAKTDGRDTLLWSRDQTVSKLYDQENTLDDLRTATVPLFLANFARFWRGDLVLNFTAIRTQFHAGKLLIGFIPHNDDNDTVPSVAEVLDYHSVVWDLSVTDNIEFTLPFTSSRAWSDFDYDNGEVFVKILSPLVAPENVASSVPITVSVACGDNFAVAAQQTVHMVGTYGGAAVTESDNLPENTAFQVEGDVPYTTLSSDDAELYCIGNAMRSCKQLISKAVPIVGTPVGILPPESNLFSTSLDWVGSTLDAANKKTDNFHSLVMGAYGLHRGSWSLTAIADTFGSLLEARTDTSTVVRSRDTLSISVPFYSPTSRRQATSDIAAHITHRGKVFFEVNAGDDFQLGCFLHTPWVSTGAAAPPPPDP